MGARGSNVWSFVRTCVLLLQAGTVGWGAANSQPGAAGLQDSFCLPENPDYTILDSAKDSVRFTVERTLVAYKGRLSGKSSFVDKDGNVMGWHDFGNLEGPGWAANTVGGAYELYCFGQYSQEAALQAKALSLLDHVLEGGFIDYETGFITGYRETTTDKLCLN